MGNTKAFAEQVSKRFQFWESKIHAIDFVTIRWLCHGHIGLKAIWEAYNGCVVNLSNRSIIDNPTSGDRKALIANESLRFNSCASAWSRMIKDKQTEFPFEVFQLLDIVFLDAN